MDEIDELIKCCVILHNMTVEARMGSLTNADYEPEAEDQVEINFPLFGRSRITQLQAALDGVDLFAARMGAFSDSMESSVAHFALKKDLVEHIFTNH